MKTKQFLMISERRTDLFSSEEFAVHVGAEAVRARELYGEGFIRQIWHRADGRGACILSEAENIGQVQEKPGSLPMIARGMLGVSSLMELVPYKGFYGL